VSALREVFVTDADTLLDPQSLPAGTRAWADYADHYVYDLVGNRLTKTTDLGNDTTIDETIESEFDANDRLTQEVKDVATGTDTTTLYEYDRTQQTAKAVYEGTPGNLGDLQSSTDFQYDLQGRLAVATVTTYEEGDPVRIERTTYDYDASGIRVSALHEVDSDADDDWDTRTLTEYLNDPRNHTGYSQVLRETHINADTEAVEKVVEYTLGHDQISQTTIEYVDEVPGTPETVVFAADGHGSTRLLLNAAGAVATLAGARQLFHYDAYGNAVGFNAAAAATTFLYSGEQFDPRIGQQYLRARYYDPNTGRFNRLDPFFGNLHDPQSLHKYLFVHGDPINGIDPTGLSLIATMSSNVTMAVARVTSLSPIIWLWRVTNVAVTLLQAYSIGSAGCHARIAKQGGHAISRITATGCSRC